MMRFPIYGKIKLFQTTNQTMFLYNWMKLKFFHIRVASNPISTAHPGKNGIEVAACSSPSETCCSAFLSHLVANDPKSIPPPKTTEHCICYMEFIPYPSISPIPIAINPPFICLYMGWIAIGYPPRFIIKQFDHCPTVQSSSPVRTAGCIWKFGGGRYLADHRKYGFRKTHVYLWGRC